MPLDGEFIDHTQRLRCDEVRQHSQLTPLNIHLHVDTMPQPRAAAVARRVHHLMMEKKVPPREVDDAAKVDGSRVTFSAARQ